MFIKKDICMDMFYYGRYYWRLFKDTLNLRRLNVKGSSNYP